MQNWSYNQTRVGVKCRIGRRANSHLLVEKIQPSEENKKPLPLLPWEQFSHATDALQEAA